MNTQIYEEATEWLIKHREAELTLEEKGQFDTWLRASPQHVRAYLEMSAIWEDLPALGADCNPAADQLIARAHGNGNVRRLADTARIINPAADIQCPLPMPAEAGRNRPARGRFFALAALVLMVIGAAATWYTLERNIYATDIGEQRSIILTDGSTLELNSRSRVRIRYTEARRDVDLLEGQALFRVAHNTARPFVVHSGMTQVLAVGTQFDVYQKPAATVVTVVDGRVAVVAGRLEPTAAKSGGAGGILLAAGEQLTVPTGEPSGAANPSAGSSPQPANIATATAWTRHNLLFESAPLTEVAEEFNRYNRRPLVITAPEIANIRISGMFSSVDPALLLKFLRSQPELHIEETDREIRIGKR